MPYLSSQVKDTRSANIVIDLALPEAAQASLSVLVSRGWRILAAIDELNGAMKEGLREAVASQLREGPFSHTFNATRRQLAASLVSAAIHLETLTFTAIHFLSLFSRATVPPQPSPMELPRDDGEPSRPHADDMPTVLLREPRPWMDIYEAEGEFGVPLFMAAGYDEGYGYGYDVDVWPEGWAGRRVEMPRFPDMLKGAGRLPIGTPPVPGKCMSRTVRHVRNASRPCLCLSLSCPFFRCASESPPRERIPPPPVPSRPPPQLDHHTHTHPHIHPFPPALIPPHTSGLLPKVEDRPHGAVDAPHAARPAVARIAVDDACGGGGTVGRGSQTGGRVRSVLQQDGGRAARQTGCEAAAQCCVS